MTEQTTVQVTENGAETKADAIVNKGPFTTPEEAEAVRPACKAYQLFTVTGPDGATCLAWARDIPRACAVMAQAHGYTAVRHGKTVAKADVAAALAKMTPEERAAILAQFNGHEDTTPAPKGKKGKKAE